jgi:1,2-diacylglycerol 3-beta-glucosyltransferase
MMNLLSFLHYILLLFVGMVSLYLMILSLGAWSNRRRKDINGVFQGIKKAKFKFLILIPAHNEATSIASTIENLAILDYPKDFIQITVLADNCQDETAHIANSLGVKVWERKDTQLLGKGRALDWACKDKLPNCDFHYDALVIMDADSSLNKDFFWFINDELNSGKDLMQAYYGVSNSSDNWRTALSTIALAAVHFLRPLGKDRFSCSMGLKGNGMVFSRNCVEKFGYPAYGLTEDLELGLLLLTEGYPCTFIPGAQVYGEMAQSQQASTSQRMRWEGGRLELILRYAPLLIKSFFNRLSIQPLESLFDLLSPPLSLIVGLFLLGSTLAFFTATSYLGLWTFIFCFITFYVFSAMLLVRSPLKLYLSLLLTPIFVFWKFSLYLRMPFLRNKKTWVRTQRNKETFRV